MMGLEHVSEDRLVDRRYEVVIASIIRGSRDTRPLRIIYRGRNPKDSTRHQSAPKLEITRKKWGRNPQSFQNRQPFSQSVSNLGCESMHSTAKKPFP
jgi:hypothetical protein